MSPKYEAWYRKDACDCSSSGFLGTRAQSESATGFGATKLASWASCRIDQLEGKTGKLSLVSKPWEQMKN